MAVTPAGLTSRTAARIFEAEKNFARPRAPNGKEATRHDSTPAARRRRGADPFHRRLRAWGAHAAANARPAGGALSRSLVGEGRRRSLDLRPDAARSQAAWRRVSAEAGRRARRPGGDHVRQWTGDAAGLSRLRLDGRSSPCRSTPPRAAPSSNISSKIAARGSPSSTPNCCRAVLATSRLRRAAGKALDRRQRRRRNSAAFAARRCPSRASRSRRIPRGPATRWRSSTRRARPGRRRASAARRRNISGGRPTRRRCSASAKARGC